jgi:hypothetical protein
LSNDAVRLAADFDRRRAHVRVVANISIAASHVAKTTYGTSKRYNALNSANLTGSIEELADFGGDSVFLTGAPWPMKMRVRQER